MKLNEILDSFNIIYGCVSDGEITDIILLLPYAPYIYDESLVGIDAFYVASNQLYHIAKQVERTLSNNGFIVLPDTPLLKPVAEKCGLGSILYNQLLCNSEYGSKITLQGIRIRGQYNIIREYGVKNICHNCHKCDIACPAEALKKGRFLRERCLRHIQDNPDILSFEMGNRILGCDICQKVCPYNSNATAVRMPEDLKAILNKTDFIGFVNGGKKNMQFLASFIGKNYAKPSWLLCLFINTLLINNDYGYMKDVESLLSHSNEKVRLKAVEYLDKLH